MSKQVTLTLKQRQIEILLLLYKFRFLNRVQIQTSLKHKQFNRVIIWLNELTLHNYTKHYEVKTLPPVPTVYSLGTQGRKYLKKHHEKYHVKQAVLDRVWQEAAYSQKFRMHCMFLFTIYQSLLTLGENNNAQLKFLTKTELHGMKYLILDHPDAFFSITEQSGTVKRYFLDIFNPYSSRAELYKRVQQYGYYFKKQYWQNHNSHPFPDIIFICPDDKSKNYLKKTILTLLEKEPDMSFSLGTWHDIQSKGISKQVLQKVLRK